MAMFNGKLLVYQRVYIIIERYQKVTWTFPATSPASVLDFPGNDAGRFSTAFAFAFAFAFALALAFASG